MINSQKNLNDWLIILNLEKLINYSRIYKSCISTLFDHKMAKISIQKPYQKSIKIGEKLIMYNFKVHIAGQFWHSKWLRLCLILCKMFFKYKIFSGENIFQKIKYFQVFGGILKKYFEKYFLVFGCVLENNIENTFSTCCSHFLSSQTSI